MLTKSFTLLVLAFAVAGSALAQCPVPSPSPAPTPVPPQQSYTCPAASSPAVLGSGPAVALQNITGPNFNGAYIQSMYQQHAGIAGLAEYGGNRVTDPEIRKFSLKIVAERNDMNAKLSQWYRDFTGVAVPPISTVRGQNIARNLETCSAADFDRQYVITMMTLMGQERDAARLGVQRLTDERIRDQANLVANVATEEINALQIWLNTGVFPK